MVMNKTNAVEVRIHAVLAWLSSSAIASGEINRSETAESATLIIGSFLYRILMNLFIWYI
jgi:hypothetical protein